VTLGQNKITETSSSLNSPISGIGLFSADSGLFDGYSRVCCRMGSMVDSENVGLTQTSYAISAGKPNRCVFNFSC
jgi:hypothetical protein